MDAERPGGRQLRGVGPLRGARGTLRRARAILRPRRFAHRVRPVGDPAMSCWRGAACLVIAGAFVPCTARCAEPPRLLAERISVSLTESPAPAKLAGRARDPFLLTSELAPAVLQGAKEDRKSTRLNSSHGYISYAVFCLKK